MRSYSWDFAATLLDYPTESGSSLNKMIVFDKAFDSVPKGLVTMAGFRFNNEYSTHEISVTLGTVTTTGAEIQIKLGKWGRLTYLHVSVFFTNSNKKMVNEIHF
jgi:H-type lectin domain.